MLQFSPLCGLCREVEVTIPFEIQRSKTLPVYHGGLPFQDITILRLLLKTGL